MNDSRPGPLARAAAIRTRVARGGRLGRALVRGAEAALGRLGEVPARMERWQRQRLAMRELERLDDRLLKDIGLRRDQIPAAAAGLYQREPEALPGTAAETAPQTSEDERLKPAA